jgi:hypothetical protein
MHSREKDNPVLRSSKCSSHPLNPSYPSIQTTTIGTPQFQRRNTLFTLSLAIWPYLTYFAPILTNQYIPVYSYNFDSTLGYPGEGPPTTIISYNINGAKDRLRAVLLDASRARVDAILLQEIHHYQDGWDTTAGLGLTSMCHGLGWIPFLSPGNSGDPKGGTAVVIRRNSSNIRTTENSKKTVKKLLNGRLTAVEVLIQGEPIWLFSIYLNASLQARKSTLDALDRITPTNPPTL